MLHNLKYDVDIVMLKEQAMSVHYEPFVDPLTQTVMPLWLMCRKVDGYGAIVCEYFSKILDTEVKPRFIVQKKGFVLNYHKDRGTKSAINFVLSTQDDPIRFRKTVDASTSYYTFNYKQALIDVQQEHEVVASSEDRYLFKLSLPDLDFNEAKKRLVADVNKDFSTIRR